MKKVKASKFRKIAKIERLKVKKIRIGAKSQKKELLKWLFSNLLNSSNKYSLLIKNLLSLRTLLVNSKPMKNSNKIHSHYKILKSKLRKRIRDLTVEEQLVVVLEVRETFELRMGLMNYWINLTKKLLCNKIIT